MKKDKTVRAALASLFFNIAYAVGNIALGLFQPSAWFFTMGIYYLALSIMRFSVLLSKKKEENPLARKFVGVMLMISSIPLLGITVLSAVKERGRGYHEILMIAIALYTFSKMTLAIVNLIKAKRRSSDTVTTIRNISFADGLVSIASLQRSMLVSFEGMTASEIKIFNILTSSAVCLSVFIIGFFMIRKNKTTG